MNALLIFIKNPEPGRVKTRLAATVGDERALAIYRELLRHTREAAAAVDADRLLFYSHYIDTGDAWPAAAFRKFRQQGADLGERMDHAFRLALARHERAVIIGSDCASLTPGIIREAFDRLGQYAAVIGPARDGGYYLLGLREPLPALFSDMPWSTPDVLPLTLRRLHEHGRSCYRLPELSDIDTEEDWRQYGWELRL